MRDFVAVSRFVRNWSPVSFDQLVWRRRRDFELTDAMEVSHKVKSQEEMVEGIRVVCESAGPDRVQGKE